MLPQPRLRFLLADDPGAGKTIMAGLQVEACCISLASGFDAGVLLLRTDHCFPSPEHKREGDLNVVEQRLRLRRVQNKTDVDLTQILRQRGERQASDLGPDDMRILAPIKVAWHWRNHYAKGDGRCCSSTGGMLTQPASDQAWIATCHQNPLSHFLEQVPDIPQLNSRTSSLRCYANLLGRHRLSQCLRYRLALLSALQPTGVVPLA
jgi:hypothetical protein